MIKKNILLKHYFPTINSSQWIFRNNFSLLKFTYYIDIRWFWLQYRMSSLFYAKYNVYLWYIIHLAECRANKFLPENLYRKWLKRCQSAKRFTFVCWILLYIFFCRYNNLIFISYPQFCFLHTFIYNFIR